MKPWRVWTCVCLLSLLTGCAKTVTVEKTVYLPVFTPERFLQDCPVTQGPESPTFRQVGALAKQRKADLEACNRQLKAGRDWQAGERQKLTGEGSVQ